MCTQKILAAEEGNRGNNRKDYNSKGNHAKSESPSSSLQRHLQMIAPLTTSSACNMRRPFNVTLGFKVPGLYYWVGSRVFKQQRGGHTKIWRHSRSQSYLPCFFEIADEMCSLSASWASHFYLSTKHKAQVQSVRWGEEKKNGLLGSVTSVMQA